MPQTIKQRMIHTCNEDKYPINPYKKPITDMGYTEQEIIRIISFYLLNAPICNDGKKEIGLSSLRDYGWSGLSDLNSLERKLLEASDLPRFCIMKSSTIKKTISSMNLNDNICISHPRAVMKLNCKVELREDNTFTITNRETRMTCLFRHIRNAMAHNKTYLFPNDCILLEDIDENKNISARILIPKNSLIKWIDIIEGKRTLKI